MSFTDNFEAAKNIAKEAAQTAAAKAKELAAVAKANISIYAEEDKVKKAEIELGKLYYRDYAVGEEMDTAEYLPWCLKIDESKKAIAELKDYIASVRTEEEAQEETMRMINIYRDFAENVLAMPVIVGQKSDKERFAGAVATYSMEAMMQDGQALQAGTSHNLGQHFAKVFDIKFLDKDGVQKYVHQTSWGVSTRLIGGLIMVHSDDRGLVLPPRVAPIEAVVLPIAMHKEGVVEGAQKIVDELKAAGVRTEFDTRDQSAGWKFNEWEMKGVPVRLEVGPRDLEAGQVTIVRRDTLEKSTLPIDGIAESIRQLLDQIQRDLLEKARAMRDSKIFPAENMDELRDAVENKHGFATTMWCGSRECEDRIKEVTGATSRVMPFEQHIMGDKCVCCGKPAKINMLFARSY